MTVQRELHDSQTFWLLILTESHRNNGKELHLGHGKGYLPTLTLRYAGLSTVENSQPSFCTLGGVLVLVFASIKGWQAPLLTT